MDSIREAEASSIRRFLTGHADQLTGRVLDYGCGLEPYRDIVETAGGLYLGYDRSRFAANVSRQDVGALGEVYDTIVCTQVIQYVPTPYMTLARFRYLLDEMHGTLLLTGPTNWPEVEQEDLHRFTMAGIRRLVERVGFKDVEVESRHNLDVPGFPMSLGWQLVAHV